MPERSAVIYLYDGSLDGFFCCVFNSFAKKEIPQGIYRYDSEPLCMYEVVNVDYSKQHAKRVRKGITEKLSKDTLTLIIQCFLSDTEQRELLLLEFLHYCFKHGKSSARHLGEDSVIAVQKAAQRARMEAHNFKGFIRFTQRSGILVSEINPRCRVLPLIKTHFSERFPNENIMIVDNTHNDVLLQSGRESRIVPFDSIKLNDADEGDEEYAKLWKVFFDTIAIEDRYNPRCQMTHLPKRYRNNMTEFTI